MNDLPQILIGELGRTIGRFLTGFKHLKFGDGDGPNLCRVKK